MISSNVKYRACEWSRRESGDIDCKTRGARVSEREASESTLLAREDFRSSDFSRDPRFLPHGRYFAGFRLLLASARRSVFLRRALRFLTLSLPWLCPISFNTRPPVAPSQFVGGSTLHVSD